MLTWRARELVVPLMMIIGVAAYWIDAHELSASALAFPGALMLVILICVGIVAGRGFFVTPPEAEPAREPILDILRPWLLVVAPLPLIMFWRDIGALPALIVMILVLLLFLGERRWIWLIALPLGLSLPIYYLFKAVLYVRLPGLPFGLGF